MSDGHDFTREVIRREAAAMLERCARFAGNLEHNGGRALYDLKLVCVTCDDWETLKYIDDDLPALIDRGAQEMGVAVTGLTSLKVEASRIIEDAAEQSGTEEEFAGFGNHGLDKVSQEAVAELDAALNAVIAAWVIRHDIRAECAKDIVDIVKLSAAEGDRK